MGHDGDLQRFSRPWLFMDRWIGRERPCSARFRSFSIFFPPVSAMPVSAPAPTITSADRQMRPRPSANRIRVERNAWEGPACQDVPLNRNRLWLNRSSARSALCPFVSGVSRKRDPFEDVFRDLKCEDPVSR